jgi:hypothetical protein
MAMQRPTLNPTVFDDPDRQPLPAMPREPWRAGKLIARLFRAIAQVLATFWHLLWTPIVPRRVPRSTEQRSFLARAVAPLIFRLMFGFILLLVTVVLIVQLIAHPLSPAVVGPPISGAVHVERVSLKTTDGVGIEAFLAQAMDEDQLLKHGEVAIRAKWPAVVLVPDQRGDGHDLDKLIRSLHDNSYVVMLVRLRGTGREDVPQTLGVTERLDVQAAVGYLRKLSYVDQSRISVLGTGTGATAAMLARRDDASIEHVIAYDPVESFDRVLRENINSPWLKPAVRWGFEIAHRVDVEDLDRDQLLRQLKEDVLLLDSHPARPPQRQMIARYLQAGAQQISEAR